VDVQASRIKPTIQRVPLDQAINRRSATTSHCMFSFILSKLKNSTSAIDIHVIDDERRFFWAANSEIRTL
jgi:hypothetical protein